MLILRENNTTFDLDHVPEDASLDFRFCVWDGSDPDHTDYYWLPLMFMETFSAPAVMLSIGEWNVMMPMDWNVLVCDEFLTGMEMIPLTSLNDRGFQVMVSNPLDDMIPKVHEVNIVNVYTDVKWYTPRLKHGNVLAVPLRTGSRPPCALFVKDTNRLPDPIDPAMFFE